MRELPTALSVALLLTVPTVLPVLAASPASAAVAVTRAEVDESQLRLEGTAAPGSAIRVDGVQLGTSDSSGAFRILRDPYTPPADCTVDVADGTGSVTATLSGCSTSPGDTSTPTAFTWITAEQLPDAPVGQPYLAYLVVSDPPGPSTFRFKLVSGDVPPGTRFVENTLPARPEARVTGTPTRTGSSSFTVEVREGSSGSTIRRTFTVKVV